MGSVMTNLWPDPKAEIESLTLRELTARLLVETDQEELRRLIAQLTHIVEAQLRRRQPD